MHTNKDMNGSGTGSETSSPWPSHVALQAIRADLDELFMDVRAMASVLAAAQQRLDETARDLREALATLHELRGRLEERSRVAVANWRTWSKVGAALVAVLGVLAGALVALADLLSRNAL